MERFVFVAAITGALLFGAFQIFGSPHMNITIDGDFDGGGSDDVVEVAPGRLEAQTFTATEIEVEHAAFILTITPEDRADVAIEIDNPGHAPMPEVRLDGDTLVVDGLLRGRIGNCGEETVDLRGYGEIARTDLPRVIIRAPRTLKLDINGASTTEIGASKPLKCHSPVAVGRKSATSPASWTSIWPDRAISKRGPPTSSKSTWRAPAAWRQGPSPSPPTPISRALARLRWPP